MRIVLLGLFEKSFWILFFSHDTIYWFTLKTFMKTFAYFNDDTSLFIIISDFFEFPA